VEPTLPLTASVICFATCPATFSSPSTLGILTETLTWTLNLSFSGSSSSILFVGLAIAPVTFPAGEMTTTFLPHPFLQKAAVGEDQRHGFLHTL
jgi:hypothetical protein